MYMMIAHCTVYLTAPRDQEQGPCIVLSSLRRQRAYLIMQGLQEQFPAWKFVFVLNPGKIERYVEIQIRMHFIHVFAFHVD